LRRGPPSSAVHLHSPTLFLVVNATTMSSFRLVIRGTNSLNPGGSCAFCHIRQFATSPNGSSPLTQPVQPIKRIRFTRIDGPRRTYAASSGQKLDVKRARKDVDERARIGFYALGQQQGALKMDRVKANSIAKEFLAKQNTMDHGSNIKHLSSSVSPVVSMMTRLC
jgi:hypothetical protein